MPVDSEVTIYHKAVVDGRNKQGSLSSEDGIDTSDENLDFMLLNLNNVDPDADTVVDPREFEPGQLSHIHDKDIENFIAEGRNAVEGHKQHFDGQYDKMRSQAAAKERTQQ